MKYNRIPGKHIGVVGDSGVVTIRGTDYLIVKYQTGWQIVGLATLSQPSPKDSEGQNGEIRRATGDALLYKSSNKWYRIDVTAINHSISNLESSVGNLFINTINMMLIATAGYFPLEESSPTTIASGGYLQ